MVLASEDVDDIRPLRPGLDVTHVVQRDTKQDAAEYLHRFAVDYYDGLERFNADVLPALEKLGLRDPFTPTNGSLG